MSPPPTPLRRLPPWRKLPCRARRSVVVGGCRWEEVPETLSSRTAGRLRRIRGGRWGNSIPGRYRHDDQNSTAAADAPRPPPSNGGSPMAMARLVEVVSTFPSGGSCPGGGSWPDVTPGALGIPPPGPRRPAPRARGLSPGGSPPEPALLAEPDPTFRYGGQSFSPTKARPERALLSEPAPLSGG